MVRYSFVSRLGGSVRSSRGPTESMQKAALPTSTEAHVDNVPDGSAPPRSTPIRPLELLRDYNPALEFLKDESGRLVYHNRTFQNVFAPEGGSLIGKADADWLPADVAERVRLHDQTVLATGAVMEVEEALPTPAGLRRWLVLKFPLRNENGKLFVGSVAVDISERSRRDATLRRMAAIMESSHDAVISTTLDGEIVSWNAGATQMYGYSLSETSGRPVSMLEASDSAGETNAV